MRLGAAAVEFFTYNDLNVGLCHTYVCNKFIPVESDAIHPHSLLFY